VIAYAYLIFIIYSVPVETVFVLFVVEETIVLIDNLPKGFEVSLGCVGAFGLINAGN
jgi:hypothetical protein